MVDAGDLTWKSLAIPEDRLAQQRQKAELQLEVYASGGVDAMLPGKADLALGVDWLAAAANRYGVPYVAANLDCSGWDLPPAIRSTRNGVSVVFIGVVGDRLPDTCTSRPATPAAMEGVAGLADADLYVLLSQQSLAADQRLVEAMPQIDLVINGAGRSEFVRPQPIGEQALRLAPGTRGKKLGVADISLVPQGIGFLMADADAELATRLAQLEGRRDRTKARLNDGATNNNRIAIESRLQRLDADIADAKAALLEMESAASMPRHLIANRLVALSAEVVDHPDVLSKVDAAKQQIERAGQSNSIGTSLAQNGSFVGDKACLACHREQHQQWSNTRHSKAWATLVDVKRSQDLACWACHVTGAHHPDGPKSPNEVGVLRNVGCESCHGPGRKHVEAPSKENIVRTPLVAGCMQCHDGIKDEGRFQPDVYMSKVTH